MATGMFGRLSWTDLTPFGAEVRYDLREPLTEEEQEAFRSLLWRFEVLVFRNQSLSHARQTEVMEHFAPVLRTAEGAHYISTEKEIGALGRLELPFHSDLSFVAEPRLALSLHAVDVVDDASSTKFISGTRVIEHLPPDLRHRLEGLRAVHVFPAGEYNKPAFNGSLPDWVPRHVHPALMPHPVTGKTVLYVTQYQTPRFEGLDAEACERLLKEVHEVLYAPENLFEHVWRNGDLLIWDNIATQHARGEIKTPGRRTLQKVQTGTKSFQEQWPAFSGDQMQAALNELR